MSFNNNESRVVIIINMLGILGRKSDGATGIRTRKLLTFFARNVLIQLILLKAAQLRAFLEGKPVVVHLFVK